jgi:hypothetical protein
MRPNSHKESGAKIIKDHHVDAKTKTDSPWQNRAEAGIENIKGYKATYESKQNPKTIMGLLLNLHLQTAINAGSTSQPRRTTRRRSYDRETQDISESTYT